jgi:predicted nucleotidyltransferase
MAQRTAVLEIAAAYHLSAITVVGSVATGNARTDSDIDLLGDFPSDFSLLAGIRIRRDFERVLGFSVDVIDRSSITRGLEILTKGGCRL